jgi:hypothetical protein
MGWEGLYLYGRPSSLSTSLEHILRGALLAKRATLKDFACDCDSEAIEANPLPVVVEKGML